MARPKRKTEAATLKMTPEVRDLWERCAAAELRSLTNMFEVMVRTYAGGIGIRPVQEGPSGAVPDRASEVSVPTKQIPQPGTDKKS